MTLAARTLHLPPRLCLLLAVLAITLSASCGREALARLVMKGARPDFSFHADSVPPAPDYTRPAHWAADRKSVV